MKIRYAKQLIATIDKTTDAVLHPVQVHYKLGWIVFMQNQIIFLKFDFSTFCGGLSLLDTVHTIRGMVSTGRILRKF